METRLGRYEYAGIHQENRDAPVERQHLLTTMVTGMAAYDDVLQEGIYFRQHERPGQAFAIVFLSSVPGARAFDVGVSLYRVWTVLDRLRFGITPEFPGRTLPTGGPMTILVGYGPSLFDIDDIRASRPTPLSQPFTEPRAGRPAVQGAGIPWASGITNNIASADIALQIVGPSQLAVARAVVETCQLLAAEGSPLRATGWYDGFQRNDGRSWLGFHDGVSNLSSGLQRKQVIVINRALSGGNDAWTRGGTYLAYIRTSVDLGLWRTLSTDQQELMVGRAKETGCPLVSRSAPAAECPLVGTSISDPGNEAFREPPAHVDADMQSSHVQRANQHRPHDRVDSARIFRQGFEYLERSTEMPWFEPGLNFVSFQNTPLRLLRILTQPGWLGGVNFGGKEQAPFVLIHARAAGLFVVPPRQGDEYLPGSHLFGPEEDMYAATLG